jgi:uncharacterized protein (TIGR03437 family)
MPVRIRLILCLAAPALLMAQPQRITGAIDNTQTMAVRGAAHPLAQPRYDQGAVEASFHLGYIKMMLTPTAAQQADLGQLLGAQQNPASPEFRKWLTPAQYADRFGVAVSDVAKIQEWLSAAGFSLKYTARGRDYIAFSGTAAQVEAAFHTTVHRYLVNGEMHYGASSDPLLPAKLGPLVGAVLGLNDFRPKPLTTVTQGSFSINALAPADVATIYDVNPLYQQKIDGTGQKMAIIGTTDLLLTDIQTFRANWGLGAANIQMVLGGEDPGLDEEALLEATLDLEWSGAMAPGAEQFYVYAKNPDDAVFYAVDQNLASVVSESLSMCEPRVATGTASSYRQEAQKANVQGITWAVASGDAGPASCDLGGEVASQGIAMSFPASVPEITAVGGTELNEAGAHYYRATAGANGETALSYIPEASWSDGIYGTGDVVLLPIPNLPLAASGGGASTLYSKPSWQSGPGVPADGQRDLPDVALNASGAHDPYSFVFSGETSIVGGTSASVQVFAGMLAVLNQYTKSGGLGNINPALYSAAVSSPAMFHDITVGNNIVQCHVGTPQCSTGQYGYQAGPGYDLATGLGSLDIYNLATGLSGLPAGSATVTSLAPPSTIAGSVGLTLTVNGTNFAAAAAVEWNGTALPTTFVSATQLTASISGSLIAQAGTATVTVASGATVTGPLYFTAMAPAVTVSNPRITSQPVVINADGSCTPPPAVTYFATGMKAYALFTTPNPTAAFTLIWLAPDGSTGGGAVSPSMTSGSASGSYCVTAQGPSLVNLPHGQLGTWTAMIYANGAMVAALQYTVQCTTGVPSISSIDSASAYGGYPYFASGSWLEIKGNQLGDPADPRLMAGGQWATNDFNGANAPTSLDGISVSINGKAAYVAYISPGQINVQTPEDTASGKVPVTVATCRGTTAPFNFAKQASAPGLLAPASFAINGTQYMAATFASDGAYVLNRAAGAALGLNSRPAKPGDVLIAYGVGFGDVTPTVVPGAIAGQSNALVNAVTFAFGSTNAALSYAGLATTFVGLYEFYITVPSGLQNGDYQINVTQGGTALPQTLFLTIQN